MVFAQQIFASNEHVVYFVIYLVRRSVFSEAQTDIKKEINHYLSCGAHRQTKTHFNVGGLTYN